MCKKPFGTLRRVFQGFRAYSHLFFTLQIDGIILLSDGFFSCGIFKLQFPSQATKLSALLRAFDTMFHGRLGIRVAVRKVVINLAPIVDLIMQLVNKEFCCLCSGENISSSTGNNSS